MRPPKLALHPSVMVVLLVAAFVAIAVLVGNEYGFHMKSETLQVDVQPAVVRQPDGTVVGSPSPPLQAR